MADCILRVFPATILVILFAGAKFEGRGRYHETAWDRRQAGAMQAVAALMIILHHLTQTITNYRRLDKGPITEWNAFGILFTSVFFFFSGFGLYKSRRTKKDYMNGFLKRRLTKILLPFFLTNILYVLTVGFTWYGIIYRFTALFGYPLVNKNAWFIVELTILYIAFYISFRWSKSERAAITKLTIFTILMITGSLLLGHSGEAIRPWFMGEWWYNTTILFIVGILFAKEEDRIQAFLKKWYRLLLPLTGAALIGWYRFEEHIQKTYGYYKEWDGHPGYTEKAVTLLAQTVLCVLFMLFLLLINLKVEYHNPVLGFLSGISYEIFLIHELFREALPSGGPDGLPDFAYLYLVYMFSVVSAWLIAVFIRFLFRRLKKEERPV